MGTTTTFGLIRHAETVWNRQNRIQGHMDSALTAHGIETHRRWGRFLKSPGWSWNRIVCSPSPRARESARLINEQLGVSIETLEELREQHWGEWEGLTFDEIQVLYPGGLASLEREGWEFQPPSGESRASVRDRARSALQGLAASYPGEQILIVSHQGIIKSVIYAIENRAYLPSEPKLIEKNRLHTIEWNAGGFRAGTYNTTIPEQM